MYKRSENIVRAVFYAVVASALASAYLSFPGIGQQTYACSVWKRPIESIGFAELHNHITVYANTDNTNVYYAWMLPFAYLLFFTGYFYDEWRSLHRTYETGCIEILDVFTWLCFLVQAVTLAQPTCSSVFGVAGAFLSTIAVALYIRMQLCRRQLKSFCNDFLEPISWLCQNMIWITALIFLGFFGNCCWSKCVILGTAIAIIISKTVFWIIHPSKE